MFQKNILLCCLYFTVAGSLFGQSTPTATPDYTGYGGKLSIGISIFDGFGVPVRYYAGSNVLEAGMYMGGVLLYENNTLKDYRTEPMLGAGYSYFGSRFLKEKKRRDKIRANGIALRVNQLLGDFSTTIPSLSWAQETFREGRRNRSFLFELGIQYLLPNFTYLEVEARNQVGIRLRCQWNFFLK